MNEDDRSADRVIAVTLGGSIAAVCAFFAWGAFELLTETMDPALAGAAYWSAVRDRAASNPALAVTGAVFGLGTAFGLAILAFGLFRQRGGRHSEKDFGSSVPPG